MSLKIVRRKGSPYWKIRGTVRGTKRVQESTGTTDKRQAEKYRITREIELYESGAFGKETTTFAAAMNSYLDRGGDDTYLTPINERFGMMELRDITQTVADHAAREILPDLKPATLVRNFYTPLLAVLNDAWRSGLCDKSPIQKPKVKANRVAPARQDQIEALLLHCPDKLAALMLFMSYSGARVGEAVRLVWADVDLQRAVAVLQSTKNDEPANVALHPRVVAALANLATDPGPGDSVFGYPYRWSVYKPLRAACKRAEVEYEAVKPHRSGRHRFAARLLEEGHSLQTVKEAGYWKSIKVVSDNYGHMEQSQIHDVVRKVGRR